MGCSLDFVFGRHHEFLIILFFLTYLLIIIPFFFHCGDGWFEW